jgi:hypothetical protein
MAKKHLGKAGVHSIRGERQDRDGASRLIDPAVSGWSSMRSIAVWMLRYGLYFRRADPVLALASV